MPRTTKFRVPAGTSEASVGTTLYAADATGHITATEDDAVTLLGVPGFTVDSTDEPPTGFARMIAPEPGGVSYGGEEYTIGADLTVIVPAAAVLDLISHGFTPAVVVPGVVLADVDEVPPVVPTEPPPVTPGA